MQFPDKLCHDIKNGRECQRGKGCKYSHDLKHFDENGNPKRKSNKAVVTTAAEGGQAQSGPAFQAPPVAFGSLQTQVVVEVASAEVRKGEGRSLPRGAALRGSRASDNGSSRSASEEARG